MFQKILIANRGEIACRIIRTARRMGIDTVAVFSDADRHAMHVAMADEAIHIGGSAASDSYLRGDRIIDAAKRTGAEAIHPGYGFLSENPDFVEAVEAAGLVFIGPSAGAIRAMGLKDAAKALMEKSGVPVVPGYHGEAQELVVLAGKATEIGYPVLIKARAGGGGKGMRLVKDASSFGDALSSAKREAESSFGDGRVLVEKYVSSPRHIEVQVFGDNHGNVVYLFERDCSLQRRHQKVIEEAPAPGMTEEMRAAMGEAAVQAAQAIGYSGAGTVEFIVDASEGLQPDRFYFMEMNTRLQVEHPVTEMVTGLDLVEWQLRVAAGDTLPLGQEELKLDGWAFEARIYAEDVAKGFIPATGTLEHLVFPETARVDSGVRRGDRITPFYDPMIAKLVVHGPTRAEALLQMASALRRTEIAGTITNVAFLEKLCRHADFSAGEVDTGLIERDIERLSEVRPANARAIVFAAIAALGLDHAARSPDPFDMLGPWSHWTPAKRIVHLENAGRQIEVTILRQSRKVWKALVTGSDDEYPSEIDCCLEQAKDGDITIDFDGSVAKARCVVIDNAITVFTNDATHVFGLPDESKAADESEVQGNRLYAPMPGVVKSITAVAGASVKRGAPLIVMEAMKMEMTLAAPGDGQVEEVTVREGDQVSEGDVLIILGSEAGQ
jgi:3-methylcrotonyl-CoA carboxylase alpha subunit